MTRIIPILLAITLSACGVSPQAVKSNGPETEESTAGTPSPVIDQPQDQDHRGFTLAAKVELEKWLMSDLPRGRESSVGDRSLGIPRTSNHLPVKVANGYRVAICAGAGCPLKIPFLITTQHIDKVVVEMIATRVTCAADSPECERAALSRAMVVMEMIVHDESLKSMTSAEQTAVSTTGTYAVKKQMTQDCVDQATNGITYLMILAEENLLKHHQIVHPGRINIAIIQPHFFTQIKSRDGTVYRFDLYHRGRFGIPPYISPIN